MKSLLDASRARLVTLLGHGGLTADELASKLGVTTNAVREHLAAMERDGLVRRAGQRRGPTKPSQVFELTPEVEQFLSQAYVPLLTHLVRVVVDDSSAEHLNRLMIEVGKGLAAQLTPVKRPKRLQARVSLASALLNDHLGAVTRVERNGKYVIRGVACPLAALTGKHPSVCLAIERLVAEIVGSAVRECCQRTGRPRCCFEIQHGSKFEV